MVCTSNRANSSDMAFALIHERPMPKKNSAPAMKNGPKSTKVTNKTAFVLGFPPSASAKEVISKGKAAGITLTDRYVYSIRSKAKTRGGGMPARRGRPPKHAAGNGGSAGHRGSGGTEAQFVDLALDLGLSRAEKLLGSLRTRLRQSLP
jgi:hypothetical protein